MLPTEDTLAERAIDPRIQREMRQGEQLLWWGQPDPRRCATRPVARAIERAVWLPLGVILILALLAVLFFFVPLTLGPFKTPHLLSLLLVICAVLVASSLPKKLSAYRAVQQRERTLKDTTYAISDQRILVIVRTRQGVNSYSFTRDEVGRIERFEGRDGWGDVVFGPIRAPQGPAVSQAPPAPQLAGIANVRQVEWLLLKTFKEGEQHATS